MPTLTTRAPDSENGATLATVALVVALLAIAFAAWEAYGNHN